MQVKKECFFCFYERKYSFLRNIQKIVKKTIDKLPKRAYSANNKSIEKGENDENKN